MRLTLNSLRRWAAILPLIFVASFAFAEEIGNKYKFDDKKYGGNSTMVVAVRLNGQPLDCEVAVFNEADDECRCSELSMPYKSEYRNYLVVQGEYSFTMYFRVVFTLDGVEYDVRPTNTYVFHSSDIVGKSKTPYYIDLTASTLTPTQGYATFYDSSQAYLVPGGTTGYTYSMDAEGNLVRNATYPAGSTLPKSTGVLFERTATGDILLVETEDEGTAPADPSLLLGSDTDSLVTATDSNEKHYVLAAGTDSMVFKLAYDIDSVHSFTNKAHEAYLYLNAVQGEDAPLVYNLDGSEDISDKYAALVAEAEAAIALTGIGYPTGTARTTFQAEIDAAKAGSPTVAKMDALQAALDAYYKSSDIQMPEDGKVYTLTFVGTSGDRHYLDQPELGILSIVDATTDPLPATAQFIARKTGDGKYVFVNANGSYLQSITSIGGMGQSPVYDAVTCEAIITSLAAYAPGTQAAVDAVSGRTEKNAFGLLCVGFAGCVGAEGSPCTLVDRLAYGTFDTSEYPCFDDTYTSGLLIEEVADADIHATVRFNADSKGTGNYASYYNYYPTAVPEGATAYTASPSATTGYITLNKIDGDVIPACTAVVLKSATLLGAQTVRVGLQTDYMNLPANILQGALADTANPGNVYVLSGTADEGVGFFKLKATSDIPACRAYYTSSSEARAFFFSFDHGTTTAVELNAATATSEGTTFDLSGRPVNHPARGLYVIDGRKVVR